MTDIDAILDDLRFFRIKEGGRVHVFRDYFVPPVPGVEGFEDGDPVTMAQSLVWTHRRALCGRSAQDAQIIGFAGTSCFHDRELCQDCWRVVPTDKQHLLFEHDTPEGR